MPKNPRPRVPADWRPPAEDDIRRRAYEIYLERARPRSALDDWLEAEAELRVRRPAAVTAATTKTSHQRRPGPRSKPSSGSRKDDPR